jgi:hypothetical protein
MVFRSFALNLIQVIIELYPKKRGFIRKYLRLVLISQMNTIFFQITMPLPNNAVIITASYQFT